MPSALILFAHPAFERSRVNRRLLDAAAGVPDVHVRDLYELYPDFDVDAETEQAQVERHDILIFQHPFYWYSTPALLKQWQDLVLTAGWAFGPGGTRLQGKSLLTVTSTGGRAETYATAHRFSMRQLLAPFEQTATLCGMRYLPPFVVHGTHRLGASELETHARHYAQTLRALCAGELDVTRLENLSQLNEALAPVAAAPGPA